MSIYVNDRLVPFTKYPNGETVVPEIQLGKVPSDVVVRLHWEYDGDLVQLALVRGLLHQMLSTPQRYVHPTLYIDYMPYSRMDRAQDGHCFSLKYVAKLIRDMDWRKVFVVEPHSLETLLQFNRTEVHPVWATAKLTPRVMQMVGFDKERDYLVLPDKGAFERYSEQMEELISQCHLVVMKKTRDFASGKINGVAVDYTILRGGSPGTGLPPRALIIDDLSSKGGTFVAAAKVLRETMECEKVNLLVTHMEPTGLTGDLPKELDRVFFTDTMTLPRPLPGNFEPLSRSEWA